MSTPLPTRLVQAAAYAVAKVQNVPFPGRKQEKIARTVLADTLTALVTWLRSEAGDPDDPEDSDAEAWYDAYQQAANDLEAAAREIEAS